MNFQKYFVLGELLELSKKSDEIIGKSLANAAIYDSFFEETKNKIRQILNSNFSQEKLPKSSARKRKGGLKLRLKSSFKPLLEYRAHVHVKDKDKNFTIQEGNPCNKASLSLEVKSKGSSDSTITLDSTDNANINCVAQSETEDRHQSSVEEVEEIEPSWEPSPEGYLNSNGIPRNINRLASKVSNNISFCQIEPNSEAVKSPQITPDVKIKNCVEGRTYVVKGKKFNKFSFNHDKTLSNSGSTFRNTGSNKRYAMTTNGSSDGLSNTPENLSNIVFSETYLISSDSSKENIKGETPEENYKTPPNLSTRLFNMDVEHKCLKKGKSKKCTGTPLRSNTEFSEGNITKHKFSDDIPVRLRKRKEKSQECDVFSNHNISLAVEEKILTHKSSYRLRSLEKKCNNLKVTKDALEVSEADHFPYASPHVHSDYGSTSSNISGNRLLELNGFPNQRSEIDKEMTSFSRKRKLSHNEESPMNSTWELGGKREEPEIKDSVVVKEGITTKSSNKILDDKRIYRRKKSPRQLQVQSAPASQKKELSRRLRPSAPVELMANCNRQSLKVKAEEKQKAREIRVQKTKERRQRLEKEREEIIRLREQRLKQRFQQHEEMLKQKTEKFKIKSQNQQHRNAKRNLPSASSKDSKEDRAEDNDDFCRNGVDSGQKLSKESNGYHDVSPKKVDLASLEGNAGINPDISEKHNAVLVGSEKTPVKFAISCNGSELKKTGNVPLGRRDSGLKEFKESVEHHDRVKKNTHLDTNSGCKSEDMAYNLKPVNSIKHCNRIQQQNLDNSDGTHYKTPKVKKIDRIKLFANDLFNKNASEKKDNSYFLRSTKKIYPNKYVENSILNSTVMDIANIKSKSEKVHQELSCKESASPSENVKNKCRNPCFKYCKNHKSRKNLKILCNNKLRQNNKCSMQSINTEDSVQQPNKENVKISPKIAAGTAYKKQKLTSYKISDFHENSFDESKVDPHKIPLWATGLYLKQALIYQHYKPPKAENIFGTPNEPVNLVDIFARDKPEYHKRTSSEHWSIPSTPTTKSAVLPKEI